MNLKSMTPSAGRPPGDAAERGEHGLGQPGLALRLGEALRVGAQVEELQGVGRPQLLGDEADATGVGEQGHAGMGRHGVVVAAMGTDVEDLLQLARLARPRRHFLQLRPGGLRPAAEAPSCVTCTVTYLAMA